MLSLIGIGEGRRALDIGCARGHLLGELENRGWKCIGIDTDESDVAICNAHGLVALKCDITTDSHTNLGLFDLVVLADVLEHVPDPLRVLRHVYSLLNPGAQIVVSVPNVAHISTRLQLLFGRFQYVERGILDRTHLRFFTRRALIELLTDCNFDVQQMVSSAVPLEVVWPYLTRSKLGRMIVAVNDRLPDLWSGGFAYQYIVVATRNNESHSSAVTLPHG